MSTRVLSGGRWPVLLLGTVCVLGLAAAPPHLEPSPDRFLRHVAHLSSADLKGRGNGTAELQRAAEYVAAEFASYGLEPLGDRQTYFQQFPITERVTFGESNALRINGTSHRLWRDFEPLSLSAAGTYEGGLVFAGYGMTAPEVGWDDYAHIDVSGKAVLVLSHYPWEPLASVPPPGSIASFETKVRNARLHGARAILIVTDPNNHPGVHEFTAIDTSYLIPHDMGIMATFVTRRAIEPLFALMGKTLSGVQHEIDRSYRPASFELTGAAVRIVSDLSRTGTNASNVLAALPNRSWTAKNEWIVIGAHYDHLGHGHGPFVSQQDTGQTHHGADDNASGTAGLLELARLLARNRNRIDRSILFVAFAGEEAGMIGSNHFVDVPPVPLTSVAAMLNLDMIGRLSRSPLNVMGGRVPEPIRGWIRRENERVRLTLSFSAGESAASDWAVFQAMGVPAMTFFTGMHEDYHRPSDTVDKINVPGAMRILRLVEGTVRHMAGTAVDVRRAPVRPVRPAAPAAAPSLGALPVFSPSLDALLFEEVPAGTPAARAGIRPGDVIVEFAESPVRSVAEFEIMLQMFRPGDMTALTIRRSHTILRLAAVLDASTTSASAANRRRTGEM